MKRHVTQSILYLLVILVIAKDCETRVRCDRSLVQAFMLKGLKYSVNERMEVCPMVHERCCSLMDEVVIVKYWKQYAEPALLRFNNTQFTALHRILEFHKLFHALPKEDMALHYVSNRWVPYINRLCHISGPRAQLEQTNEQKLDMINRLFPGTGSVEEVRNGIFLKPISISLKETLIDKATINVYLALIIKVLRIHYNRYIFPLMSLYDMEKNTDTMNLAKKIVVNMNFEKIKHDFLDEVRKAKKKMLSEFEKILAHYEGRDGMADKIQLAKESFTNRFVNILEDIETFMLGYNKTKRPTVRVRMISKFRGKLESKVMGMLYYIKKLNKELGDQKNSAESDFEGRTHRIEIEKEYKNHLKRKRRRKKEQQNIEIETGKEHEQLFKERNYDPNNDIAVSDDAAESEDMLKKSLKRESNNLNKLPIDEERKLGQVNASEAVQKFRETFQKRKEEIKKELKNNMKSKRDPYFQPTDAQVSPNNSNMYQERMLNDSDNQTANNPDANADLFTSNSYYNGKKDNAPAKRGLFFKKAFKGIKKIGKKGFGGIKKIGKRGFQGIKNLSKKGLQGIKNLGKSIFRRRKKRGRGILSWLRNHKARRRRWRRRKIRPLVKRLGSYLRAKIIKPYIDEKLFNPKTINDVKDEKLNMIECEIEGKHLYRHFIVSNKHKTRFCLDRYAKFKKFNPDIFEKVMVQNKAFNLNMLNLKKTLYCSICDANYQRSFVHEKQLIVYEEEFCRNLLDKFESYISWKNIILIEYMDLTLQLLTCYETPANFVDYPLPSFLDKAKRLIYFVKRCLERRDKKDFMMYCHFLCTDFKLKGFSQLLDGDLKIIDLFVLKIYNFARKVGLTPLPPIKVLTAVEEKELSRDDLNEHLLPTVKKSENDSDNFKLVQHKINKIYDSLVDKEKLKRDPSNGAVANKNRFVKKPLDKFEKLPSYVSEVDKQNDPNAGLNPGQRRQKKYKALLLKRRWKNWKYKMALKKRKEKIRKDKAMTSGFFNLHKNQPHVYNQTVGSFRELGKKKPKKRHSDLRFTKALKLIKKQQRELKSARVLEERNINPYAHPTATEDIPDQIFERKQYNYELDCYRTFYSRNVVALNPIKMLDSTNITDEKIEKILERQYKKHNQERFDRHTIIDYFSVPTKKINDFNNDVDLIKFDKIFDKKGNLLQMNKKSEKADKTEKLKEEKAAENKVQIDVTQAHGREDAFIAEYVDQKSTDKADEPLVKQIFTKH